MHDPSLFQDAQDDEMPMQSAVTLSNSHGVLSQRNQFMFGDLRQVHMRSYLRCIGKKDHGLLIGGSSFVSLEKVFKMMNEDYPISSCMPPMDDVAEGDEENDNILSNEYSQTNVGLINSLPIQ
ncbi:hypothetical protein VNO78_04526 [Psophocarpus tetragonolobus]|uniref:Uncharacterized protein n=1 Tax=Psophocarpus tetragonolobus TaxID=3891 RepID=A0AAN9T1Z3_PSOTE